MKNVVKKIIFGISVFVILAFFAACDVLSVVGGGNGGAYSGVNINPPLVPEIKDDTLVCTFEISGDAERLGLYDGYAGVDCQLTSHDGYFANTFEFDYVDWGDGTVQYKESYYADQIGESDDQTLFVDNYTQSIKVDYYTITWYYHTYPRQEYGASRTYTCKIYGCAANIGTAFNDVKTMTTFRIPDNCTNISFSGCKILSDVMFGKDSSLASIPSFWGCYKLRNVQMDGSAEFPEGYVTFPDTVTSGSILLSNCSSVKSVFVPDTVTSLQLGLSALSNLKRMTLGASVASIGPSIIDECPNLTDVYFKSNTPPTLYWAIFGETGDGGKIILHVPAIALAKYLRAENYPTDRIVID